MFSNFSIAHVQSDARADAREQLSIVLIISFLPLIIGFLAVVGTSEYQLLHATLDSFPSVFFNGELYFYTMSCCASIYFLSSFNEKRGIRGMRLWSGVFVILCVALMALYVGQGQARNTTFHGFLSVALLAIAVHINYRVIVLSHDPPPMPENVHRDEAQAMADELDPEYD